jgi:hypothetical protein
MAESAPACGADPETTPDIAAADGPQRIGDRVQQDVAVAVSDAPFRAAEMPMISVRPAARRCLSC